MASTTGFWPLAAHAYEVGQPNRARGAQRVVLHLGQHISSISGRHRLGGPFLPPQRGREVRVASFISAYAGSSAFDDRSLVPRPSSTSTIAEP